MSTRSIPSQPRYALLSIEFPVFKSSPRLHPSTLVQSPMQQMEAPRLPPKIPLSSSQTEHQKYRRASADQTAPRRVISEFSPLNSPQPVRRNVISDSLEEAEGLPNRRMAYFETAERAPASWSRTPAPKPLSPSRSTMTMPSENTSSFTQSVTDFRDGFEPRPTDIFIAVMGVTGAGKSTFIALCTQKEVKIGHNLQACTQEVAVYACRYSASTTVYLVDTPGFDDTNRSDTDVLREIATWLTISYSNNVKLSGIIYLHRIIDLRMQGSAKKNLFMFKKLCGPSALKNVVLATTMWEKVVPREGWAREKELVDTPEFWGWMMDNGSRVYKHMNHRDSAMDLLLMFTGVEDQQPTSGQVVLSLQEEMVDQHKGLDQTTAGLELEGAIGRERERFRQELAQLQRDMEEAIVSKDKESAEVLLQNQREMEESVRRLDRERRDLKTNMERLHQEKYNKLQQILESAQEESARHQRALKEAREEKERQTLLMYEERRQRLLSERTANELSAKAQQTLAEARMEQMNHQIQIREEKDKRMESERVAREEYAKTQRALAEAVEEQKWQARQLEEERKQRILIDRASKDQSAKAQKALDEARAEQNRQRRFAEEERRQRIMNDLAAKTEASRSVEAARQQGRWLNEQHVGDDRAQRGTTDFARRQRPEQERKEKPENDWRNAATDKRISQDIKDKPDPQKPKTSFKRLVKVFSEMSLGGGKSGSEKPVQLQSPSMTTLWPNRVNEDVSLTLFGAFYFFCGPAQVNCIPPNSYDQSDVWGMERAPERENYVAFGKNQSWYRFCEDLRENEDTDGALGGWAEVSPNFATEYPQLNKHLKKAKSFQYHRDGTRPECVSLGNNGDFFWRASSGLMLYSLPQDVEEYLGNMGEVKSLWLGMAGAWVAVRTDDTMMWDLKGQYQGLRPYFKNGSETCPEIKALALNPLDRNSWAIVWYDGTSDASTGNNTFDMETWKEFTATNFGTP